MLYLFQIWLNQKKGQDWRFEESLLQGHFVSVAVKTKYQDVFYPEVNLLQLFDVDHHIFIFISVKNLIFSIIFLLMYSFKREKIERPWINFSVFIGSNYDNVHQNYI